MALPADANITISPSVRTSTGGLLSAGPSLPSDLLDRSRDRVRIAVHTQQMKEKPDEIVKMIKAVLKATDYIRNRKAEILSHLEAKWGIKESDVRESIYRDMVGLFTKDGVASDQTMNNVVQLVRDTRKTKDDKTLADIFDWSFARKAQAELKIK